MPLPSGRKAISNKIGLQDQMWWQWPYGEVLCKICGEKIY